MGLSHTRLCARPLRHFMDPPIAHTASMAEVCPHPSICIPMTHTTRPTPNLLPTASTGTDRQSGGHTLQWVDQFPSKAVMNPCGDPLGNDRNMVGSFPTTQLDISTGVFPIKFAITTNHWGRIRYRLYTNENDLNTERHVLLERADGKGIQVYPPQENGKDGDGMRALGQATNADWLGGWGDLYQSEFRWPAGVTCQPVCVIQMEWVTGHSCTPEGVPDANAKFYGGQPAVPCSKQGSPWPEVFLNCANVVVGSGSVAVSAATTTNTTITNTTVPVPAPMAPHNSTFKPGEEPAVMAQSGP